MRHPASTPSRRTAGALGAGALVAAAVLVLAACSTSQPQPASAGQPPSSAGQLGSTLAVSDSNGTKLDVTLQKVIDPASGANQYSEPASGNHFVGVELHVQNKASGTYQNNANNETTIILSDGKTLYADYNPIAGCGNFDNGQITLKSDATSTGCVTFQVPKSQTVAQVRYSNTVFPGQNAQWRVS